jgi:hypothetical protein
MTWAWELMTEVGPGFLPWGTAFGNLRSPQLPRPPRQSWEKDQARRPPHAPHLTRPSPACAQHPPQKKVYKLPAERLYATYFGGDAKQGLPADDEARKIWLRFLPTERVGWGWGGSV